HSNATRIEDLVDRGRDLGGHVLLRLQAPRIDVDEARELGEPDHAVDWLIGDVGLADERHHVMLAVGVEGDVAHQHEVVVAADLVEGAVEHLGRALAIPAIKLLVGVDDALGSLDQAFARRVVARKGDQRAHRSFRVLARGARDLRGYSLDLITQGCLAQRLDDSVHDGLSVRPVPLERTGGVTGAAASALEAPWGINPVRRPDAAFPIQGSSDYVPIPSLYYTNSPTAKGTAGLRQTNLAPLCQSLYIACKTRRNCREQARNPLPEAMINDVYNKRIIELAGNIPRLGRLSHAQATATAHSKLCGSTVTVDLKMEGDEVTDFAHEVKACALGQASSSIMARNVIGAKAEELRNLREIVRRMLKENGAPPDGKWADIAVLEPVRDYKARHASTMLTFDAVTSAIDQIEAKRKAAMAAE